MDIYGSKGLHGSITVPGDKSISHRSIMLGSISEGTTTVHGFLNGADCISTIGCFRSMGVDIKIDGTDVTIRGVGLGGLKKPSGVLDCGNSGTTTRMISGILSGQEFDSELNGDASLQKRPMDRVMRPLSMMGASFYPLNGNGCLPVRISGSKLHGIDYISPVASAQVKSSVLLAGLYASSPTSFTEPYLSRNHTELMMRSFGADIVSDGLKVILRPGSILKGRTVDVPGDISSAAFFIGAGLLIPGSEILIKNVGINPTRDGILRVFKQMGGNTAVRNIHTGNGESIADIEVKSSELHGITIKGEIIPSLIDEIPLIAVAATQAHGTTVIADASELRVKESDRIRLMTDGLSAMGADITATSDGMIINGPTPLHPAPADDALDHRVAMSFAVAALINQGSEPMVIAHPECVSISYPAFFNDLASLMV